MNPPARLHVETVTGDDGDAGAPDEWIVFLHGILGSGDNWAAFARRIVRARPGWGALLVDLRLHGDSEAGDPPHTVDAAALDVVAMLEGRGIAPRAVSGHSFGSKVAFRAAEVLDEPPEQVWLLDADPGPRPEAAGRSLVLRVLASLARLPRRFERREDFVERLVGEGFTTALAGWLGKNLRREEDHLVLALDLSALEEILEDYHSLDLWPRIPTAPFAVRAVVGGRSDVFGPDARKRLRAADAAGELTLHTIPEAAHWLHIDAPRALAEILLAEL